MITKIIPHIPRYFLGLVYFVFGAIGLLNLIPPPPGMPEKLQIFMNGIMATEYFFPLLKGTETLFGFLLLIGKMPALALVVLAPITLNIFLLHLFVTPGLENQVLPVLMIISHVLAARVYWHKFQPLIRQ